MKQFKINYNYHYNSPNNLHSGEDTIDGEFKIDAENKIKAKYPNVSITKVVCLNTEQFRSGGVVNIKPIPSMTTADAMCNSYRIYVPDQDILKYFRCVNTHENTI